MSATGEVRAESAGPTAGAARAESADMADLVGRAAETVIKRLASELVARKMTLAVAESCTGGLVAKWITDAAGASRFFTGGVVTYADQAKHKLLGVRPETLERYGAVSGETVREMLAGVRRRMDCDTGIAVTGVAGPGGGSSEKPVGTVWYGAAVGKRKIVRHERFDGSRAEIRARSAETALRLLLGMLVGEERE